MIQATTTSDFKAYISTEDNRINTSVAKTQIRHLVKLINDMDGSIDYVYPTEIINDRFTEMTFEYNATPDLYNGQVNLLPAGSWKYEIYEYSADSETGANCSTLPDPSTNVIGYYTITDPSGAVTTTNLITGEDVYEQSLTDLDAGSYLIKIYDGCGDLVSTDGFEIHTFTAQSDGTRWLEIQNIDQTATGITFDVVSNAPIGHSYDFFQGVSAASQMTNITSKPQTTSHSFTQDGLSYSGLNVIEMELYSQTGGSGGGGSLVWGALTMNTYSMKRPADGYGFAAPIVVQPVSANGGEVLSKGSAIISVINGLSQDSSNRSYYTLQGLVSKGKLLLSEKDGTQQVQYTQHPEPSGGTNYIYYGQ